MDKADREPERAEPEKLEPMVLEPMVPEPENREEDRPKPNEPWSLTTLPRQVALTVIRFYQRAISPLTPPTCRFHPTCSHYTYDAIARFGLARGALLGSIRLCKCNPFHRGGYDPVPEVFTLKTSRPPVIPPTAEPGVAEPEMAESKAVVPEEREPECGNSGTGQS